MRRIFLFVAIILCLAGYAYAASDVTYDILNYYPLTPGNTWEYQNGLQRKIVDYGQINGHHAFEVIRWYPASETLKSNLVYYDGDYLYFYSYRLNDDLWIFNPVLKLKRNIKVGEVIGNDFDRVKDENNVISHTYSRTLLSIEDVTSPAGEFKGCLKFSRVMDGVTDYEWWAPNVGIVKYAGTSDNELVSYRFAVNHHNAAPSQSLPVVNFPTGITPSNNEVQVGACSDVMIQPTLAVPSVDVGKTATLIMYIYMPDAGFGVNIPSKTKVLTSETKFDLLPQTIDFSDSAGLNFYIYYGYIVGSTIKYNAYSVIFQSNCSLVPDCNLISDLSTCNATAGCIYEPFAGGCLLDCESYHSSIDCQNAFDGNSCQWNTKYSVCSPK